MTSSVALGPQGRTRLAAGLRRQSPAAAAMGRFALFVLALALVSAALWTAVPAAHASNQPSGQIAFVRDGDIWIMNSDGSGKQNVTNTAHAVEFSPSWSPSGERIAYLRGTGATADNGDPYGQLWIMKADGTDKRRVSLGFSTKSGWRADHVLSVAWSPNGKSFALSNVRSSWSCRIILADAKTGKVRTVYGSGLGDLGSLRWRPDGGKLAATWSYGGSIAPMLTTVVVGTGKATHPTYWHPSEEIGWAPRIAAWSPAGTKIAYVSASDKHMLSDFEVRFCLAVTSASGVGHTLLDSCSSNERSLGTVTWSPDGAKLAYSLNVGPYGSVKPQVWVVSETGGPIETVVQNASEPAWGH
jgi:TolB protein